VVLLLATVGHQGRPQSARCCLELGPEEDRNAAAGLSPGAQPASPAGAEPAFSQERVSKEELAVRRTAGAQASQTRAHIAAAGKPTTLFSFAVNTASLIPRAVAFLPASLPYSMFSRNRLQDQPPVPSRRALPPILNDEAASTVPHLF